MTDIASWCGIAFQNFYFPPLCHGFALYLNGEIVTELTLPDSVTSIGNYAFSGCRSLTSIAIPDGITSIGDYAFYKCVSLTSMTIPEGVTSIGDSAFEGCSSLESITIPDSVTSIGRFAFSLCSALTSATFENTSGWWVSISDSATSGPSLPESDLADPSAASANCTSAYVRHYWKRG